MQQELPGSHKLTMIKWPVAFSITKCLLLLFKNGSAGTATSQTLVHTRQLSSLVLIGSMISASNTILKSSLLSNASVSMKIFTRCKLAEINCSRKILESSAKKLKSIWLLTMHVSKKLTRMVHSLKWIYGKKNISLSKEKMIASDPTLI